MPALQHIAFNCVDPKRTEAFYARHFGFKRARVFNEGASEEFVMLRLGDTCLELFKSPAPDAAASSDDPPVGFKHLAFEVEDLDAVVSAVRAEGLETGDVIDCSADVEGLRILFFRDPDGNSIELMQGWRDDPDLA